jgi:3-ketosteroid 9alpha-monooxygenase subunit A
VRLRLAHRADLNKGLREDDCWSVRSTPELGRDGVCNDIPYAKKIPDKAVIILAVLRRTACCSWNARGNRRSGTPSRMEDYYGEWTGPDHDQVPIENNCRELVDNMADLGHFGP